MNIPVMKIFLAAFLCAAVLAAPSLGGDNSPPAAKPLQAGAAAVETTPQIFPIRVRGRVREKAHDPLHSRALVISDGAGTVAIVVVDALGTGYETCDELAKLASERTGIPPEHILIASTHSHTVPSSGAVEGDDPALVDYGKRFREGIVESIVQAQANLKPASIGWAAQPLPDEVRNRRWFLKPGKMPPNPWGLMDQVKMNPGTSADTLDRPAAPTDPDVMVLAVMDDRGRKPRAIFANYALHYVGGLPEDQVSADYFGEFARLMPFRVRGDEEFLAFMSNGASGDINNIPFLLSRPPREPGEQVRIVAGKAADAAWQAWRKIETWQKSVPVAAIKSRITLKHRRPTGEQVERARAILAITDKSEKAKLPVKAEGYARQTMGMLEEAGEVTLPLQAIRIGDFAVVGIPFETLVEIGLELKEQSPFETTMVIGLANGRYGYLPTPKQHELGGYETWLGTCKVQENASDLIIAQLLEMLGELKKG